MKLKYEYLFQQIGDQWAGVPVGVEAAGANSMLHLNDVGHDIVELMTTETDRATLISRLLDIYEASPDVIAQSVDSAISYLEENGLLEG